MPPSQLEEREENGAVILPDAAKAHKLFLLHFSDKALIDGFS